MKRIEWRHAPYGKYLRCPWNEDFQKALKEEIPEAERIWKGTDGWWISDAYLKEVENLIFDHYTITVSS